MANYIYMYTFQILKVLIPKICHLLGISKSLYFVQMNLFPYTAPEISGSITLNEGILLKSIRFKWIFDLFVDLFLCLIFLFEPQPKAAILINSCCSQQWPRSYLKPHKVWHITLSIYMFRNRSMAART